jgi:TRAP-type C4-dicarboxylate transport system permease small subunit
MKPFPWLALTLAFLFSGIMASLSYCFWHNLGPRRWYERRDKLWRLLASGALPLAGLFLSLTVVGVAKNVRDRVHSAGLNHFLLGSTPY